MAMKIVLIGAGQVAYHLGRWLAEKQMPVAQVFSRTAQHARQIGASLHIPFADEWEKIDQNAGLYIIAVKDDAIAPVADRLSAVVGRDRFAVHTSGSVASTVLAPYFDRYGVFYPLQTFSRARQPDYERVPLCLTAGSDADRAILETIASRLSGHFYPISDEQRAVLHIAAVMVNNFSNHLYALAEAVLADKQLPFELLRPLILETALKVQSLPPGEAQTGPAIRRDDLVVARHLAYLRTHHPDMAGLYEALTRSIQEHQGKP